MKFTICNLPQENSFENCLVNHMHARTNHGENMWVLVIVKDTDGRDI